ncbi:hypothetical protein BJF78_00770 [Pseudonocardia sp. CNS-139]|nr:hypothetical protein BJF78_00770 [Pseudonocardia sp. CNS-139]
MGRPVNPPLRRALGHWRAPVCVLAAAAALLFYVPFLVVVATSWTGGEFVLFPPQGFSLRWYASVLGDPEWAQAFRTSLWTSAVATAVAVVIGTLGALALSRLRSRTGRRLLRTLFIVPIAIPPVAYGAGLYLVNIGSEPLYGTFVLFVLGEAVLGAPYVFVLVANRLEQTDPTLHPAAATLGASWPMILWRVDLPLVLPSVLRGTLFAFVVIFDEVVLSVFLVPVGGRTLPLQMLGASQEAFSPQLTAASTLVSVVAVAALALFGLAARIRKDPP